MGILIALGKSNAMEHLISLNVYECVAKVEQKRFLAFVIIRTKIVSLLIFFSLKASLRANHNSPTHNTNSKSTFKTSSHSLGKFFLTVSVKNGCLFFGNFHISIDLCCERTIYLCCCHCSSCGYVIYP